MFEEAIPQSVRDIEIQWEPQDDTLTPQQVSNKIQNIVQAAMPPEELDDKLREALNNAR